MAAKGHSDSQSRGRSGRRHEILGISLLAFGLFSGLSLLSMHLGDGQMMGPGGAAAATGLYGLFGVSAYLFVLGLLGIAWRSFRGRSLVAGITEVMATVLLLGSVTVLLHLPFAGGPHRLRGPGGMMGEWLGELAAGFIGPIGAALAATTLLFVTLLLVSEIRMSEVAVVLSWAARQLGLGAWIGMRALGRLAVAMFPERERPLLGEAEDADEAEQLEPPAERVRDRQNRALLAAAPAPEDEASESDDAGVPSRMEAGDTDGVRVGRAYSDEVEDPRDRKSVV